MKTFLGNYLGVVITGGEKDPEGRGRVQVFVPHVMPALYDDWNNLGQDISFNIVGDGLPTSLPPNIIQKLKLVLPWAECAAPIVGSSPSVYGGSEVYRNVGSSEMPSRADAIAGTGGFGGNATGTDQGAYIQGKIGAPNNNIGHFDIKPGRWNPSINKFEAKRELRFERNDLDSYVLVNRRPLSSGYTLPGPRGGDWDGHVARGSFGWDYAFTDRNAALTLTNGAFWVANRSDFKFKNGEIGDQAVFQLPDGRQFAILHGRYNRNFQNSKSGVNASASSALQPDKNMKQPEEENGTYAGISGSQGASQARLFSGTPTEAYALMKGIAASKGSPNPDITAAIAMLESGNLSSSLFRRANNPFGQTLSPSQVQALNRGETISIPGVIGSTIGGDRQPYAVYDSLESAVADHISKWGDKYKNGDVTGTLRNLVANNYNIEPGPGGPGSAWQAGVLERYNAFIGVDGQVKAGLDAGTPIIQNPTPFPGMAGPNTNNQALGMFGYASEGTAVWLFFREGNPLFPVYFAASYGAREWANMYQMTPEGGIGAGDGGAIPGTEQAIFNSYGGGFRSVQVVGGENNGLENQFVFQLYGKQSGNFTFSDDNIQLNSIYDYIQRVGGDHHNIVGANFELRIAGTANHYYEQDCIYTTGNWGKEAWAASDENQFIIDKAMAVKSGQGSDDEDAKSTSPSSGGVSSSSGSPESSGQRSAARTQDPSNTGLQKQIEKANEGSKGSQANEQLPQRGTTTLVSPRSQQFPNDVEIPGRSTENQTPTSPFQTSKKLPTKSA